MDPLAVTAVEFRSLSITFDPLKRSPLCVPFSRPTLTLSLPLSVLASACRSHARLLPRTIHAACPARTPHLIKREEDHAKDDAKEIAGKAPI